MAEAALGRVTPERLAPGDARPLLAVDFQPFSSAPRLSTRLAERAHGHPVYRLDPLAELARPGGFRALTGFAADFAAGVAADLAPGPVTVIGYCACAALALRIGALIAADRPVAVVLVRPEWPAADLVGEQFALFRADLGAEPAPTPRAARPDALLAAMDRILAADLAVLAASRGLAEVPGALDELLAGYRGWLGFLLACAGDAAEPAPDAALDLNISVLTGPAGDAALPAPWPPARTVRRAAALAPQTVSPELVDLVLQVCEDR